MFKRLMAVSLLALGALALQWPAVSQTTPPKYYVTDLGVIAGADSSNATAINDSGTVVGYTPLSRSVAYYRGWVWTPNASNPTQGALTELKPAYAAPNPLAYEMCQATDISSGGMIIGYSASRNSANNQCATYWLAPNTPVDFNTLLPDPSEWALRFATALSEPGPEGDFYVCGVARHVSNPTTDVGVIWRVSGGVITSVTPLDIAPGLTDPRSNASDMNSFGQMTGYSRSTPGTGSYHPYLWEPSGQGQFLGSLTGNTQAFALNDAGVVMGWDSTLRKAWVRYPSTGTMSLLPTLSGGTQSFPMGMNNPDDIVGYSGSSKGQRACLWLDGAAYDLNNFKSGGASKTNLVTASAINDGGSITATYEGRATRAVLLTPQP